MSDGQSHRKPQTDRGQLAPDDLSGPRIRRMLDHTRRALRHAHLAREGWLCVRRSPRVDERALRDAHRCGLLRVHFGDPTAYLINIERRARR